MFGFIKSQKFSLHFEYLAFESIIKKLSDTIIISILNNIIKWLQNIL